MNSTSIIKVGMADLQVAIGEGVLRTAGLGSCVGVTLYDQTARIGGMAHIMLPDSSIARGSQLNKAKFADTAIPEMLERMVRLGASAERIQAKLAGGAQMFAFAANQSELMRIGPRNVEKCRAVLAELHIPVIGEDTGGNYGRTIELRIDTGVLIVRSVNREAKEI
jgi:chemotaxis protein CheD